MGKSTTPTPIKGEKSGKGSFPKGKGSPHPLSSKSIEFIS